MKTPKLKTIWKNLLIFSISFWISLYLAIHFVSPYIIDKFFNPTCWLASLSTKELLDLEISLCNTAPLKRISNNSWTNLILSCNKQVTINQYILEWLKKQENCKKFKDTKELIKSLENK